MSGMFRVTAMKLAGQQLCQKRRRHQGARGAPAGQTHHLWIPLTLPGKEEVICHRHPSKACHALPATRLSNVLHLRVGFIVLRTPRRSTRRELVLFWRGAALAERTAFI